MFNTIFYEPVYNLLVFALNILPLHDVGLAIILVTLFVKVVLLPLNISATKSQYALKRTEKEINNLKEKHKNNPQEMSKALMAVYKRENINPFASIFAIVLQIPVFIALYFVFSKGLQADPNALYSFLSFPETLHTKAFGFLELTQKSILVAVFTGVTAYLLAHRQTKTMVVEDKKGKEETFQDHFMKSMRIQMLYVLPIFIGFSTILFPAAVGLYWTTSNVLGIFQDVYIKKKYKLA